MSRAKSWNALLSLALVLGTGACSPSDADVLALDSSLATAVTDASGASMGSVAFPVSCGPEASSEMRRGLALLHHMTYAEAERVFRGVIDREPECALAYWGVAMTYLHPLWPDVPSDQQHAGAWELLQEARAAGLPTPREEAYVAALEAYYRDGTERTEPERLASYAEAWGSVRGQHPDDAEAAAFHALSLIATALNGAADGGDRVLEAGALAETVLEAIPDHPGAHHYVIHAFDSPALADRALSVAHRYGTVAPDNSHALHMTSHIFTRRGLWEESIDFNRRAAEAAGGLRGDPTFNALHAIDYQVYAHLQRGEDDRAAQIRDELRGHDGPVMNHAAAVYTYAAVDARIALERHDWAAAATVPVRDPERLAWDSYPHLEAIQVFSRALGQAHTGALEAARGSADRLAELVEAAAALPGAYDWGTQVRIQEIGARAWIAYAEGATDEAVRLMREAADLEATTTKNPVTPGEVLPAGELLGDMLRELGRSGEAIVAYEGALDRTWNRFNSLYGAGLAAEALGDRDRAAGFYRQLLAVASSTATRRAPLDRAEALLAEG